MMSSLLMFHLLLIPPSVSGPSVFGSSVAAPPVDIPDVVIPDVDISTLSDSLRDNLLLRQKSVMSTSDSDESYIPGNTEGVYKERLRKKKFYFLSLHEIEQSSEIAVRYFFEETTFEERVEYSSINILCPQRLEITSVLSPPSVKTLRSYVESTKHVMDMQLVNVNGLNEREKST